VVFATTARLVTEAAGRGTLAPPAGWPSTLAISGATRGAADTLEMELI
jgi:hypothetical protein